MPALAGAPWRACVAEAGGRPGFEEVRFARAGERKPTLGRAGALDQSPQAALLRERGRFDRRRLRAVQLATPHPAVRQGIAPMTASLRVPLSMPRPAEAAGAPTRFKVALAAGIVLFAVATTWTNWVRYESLRSTWPYDLGYFNNDLFNLANGRTTGYFFVTAWFDPKEHDGPSVFRTTHFFPLQNVILPLVYRASPGVLTLLLFQGVLVGL